ncbi:histidinol dehydrogenase, partial [Porticoccaceae bacterium]|nr:histidinol dehydrogenase [Porticoccaceae bacterium]
MAKLTPRRLSASAADFDRQLSDLISWEQVSDQQVEGRVRDIIAAVRSDGDAALVALTNQFDRREVNTVSELELPRQALMDALNTIGQRQRDALESAAQRIESYHRHQLQESWSYRESDGTLLGQQITPLDRAGLYVPGGKASYPSSVLMNAIPAKVAGVSELIVTVPAPDNELSPLVLAAAAIAGVNRVVTIGGAQAIAALAYGTQSIPKVDKIVGPGNIYVATAKRMVFGSVGLDMVAGPSEILVICD